MGTEDGEGEGRRADGLLPLKPQTLEEFFAEVNAL